MGVSYIKPPRLVHVPEFQSMSGVPVGKWWAFHINPKQMIQCILMKASALIVLYQFQLREDSLHSANGQINVSFGFLKRGMKSLTDTVQAP